MYLLRGAEITPGYVNSQEDSTIREASLVLSAADQEKDGSSFNVEADGALSDKLGDTEDSNAVERAAGQTVNTLNTIGGQRSVLGTYGASVFSVVFGSGSILSNVPSSACPVLTNAWVGVGVGAANLLSLLGQILLAPESGGATGETAADEAAAEATFIKLAPVAIKNYVVNKLTTTEGLEGLLLKELPKSALVGSGELLATHYAGVLAKVVFEARLGLMDDGLEKSTSFDNNVDNGANQLANEISRQQDYGRPLTTAEAEQSQQAGTQAELAYSTEPQNAFERYLSPNNPSSLISQTSMLTDRFLVVIHFHPLLIT